MSALHRPTDSLAPDAPLRVILVGQTRLDGVLRLDDRIELIRATGPLEAIAETANPIDSASPRHVTIVLGDEVDLGTLAGAFVDSIRQIDPHARLLATPGQRATMPDGTIDPSADALEVRGRVRGRTGSEPAEPAREPAAADAEALVGQLLQDLGTPAPSPTGDRGVDAVPGWTPQDDLPLIDAMVRGLDPIPSALGAIRRWTGIEDAVFTTTAPDDGRGVAVRHKARALGWLRSHAPDLTPLDRVAPWLGGWIALRSQQEQLRRAAFTDDLTGAFNRRYFRRFLQTVLEEARVNRRTVTLLFFDIDDFKSYNDNFGHGAGDEILQETVRLMHSTVRPTDRVCRIGGDEFAVVFHDPGPKRAPDSTPPETIWAIAKRFQRAICEHRFPKLGEGAPGTLTISGGLATFPWDGATGEALLARADELAIDSKNQGKNAITLGPGAQRACGLGEP